MFSGGGGGGGGGVRLEAHVCNNSRGENMLKIIIKGLSIKCISSRLRLREPIEVLDLSPQSSGHSILHGPPAPS